MKMKKWLYTYKPTSFGYMIRESIFSSSVLKGNVTFIIKQILRFSKIWITSCIWHVINSLKLNKENIKKWINGLSDMIKDPSKQLNKRNR